MFLLFQRTSSGLSSGAGADPMVTPVLVVYLSLLVLNIAAYWRIFSKAGEPGWAVLVPIYGSVKLLHITGRSGWWVLAFVVPLFNLFPIVRLAFDLARVFGRGMGFGFGLLLVPLIFAPILGFGDARYVGAVRRERPVPVLAGT
jgi:hypothetical protein